jgi:ABC-type antimicrobial peptide transport system ATPase subunit
MHYEGKTKSNWREFEFMYHQIQQAIEPKIKISTVLDEWGDIKTQLSESARRRKTQIEALDASRLGA